MVVIKENLKEAALQILQGKKLEDKLKPLRSIDEYSFDDYRFESEVKSPGRDKSIGFCEKRIKFPKNFESNESRARALHAFANHELLAIEIMCLALVKFPNTKDLFDFKKDILETIEDEQKHLRLYIQRMNELGFEFGDFPLNDFFWKHGLNMKKPEHFSSFMSLTFEMANLDFSYFYKNEFEKVKDLSSAKIMQEVFVDEIQHVKHGVHYINSWKGRKSTWDYYTENLILPLTPSRSKGISYQEKFRKTVGLNQSFISKLNDFDDNFAITQRRK